MAVHVSKELEKIIAYAKEEAMRTGCYAIVTDHLLLGILRHSENDAARALASLGADGRSLKKMLEDSLRSGIDIPFSDFDNIHLSRDAQNTLNMTMLEASMSGRGEAGPRELLLAICRSVPAPGKLHLERLGITHGSLEAYFKAAVAESEEKPAASGQVRKMKPFTVRFVMNGPKICS